MAGITSVTGVAPIPSGSEFDFPHQSRVPEANLFAITYRRGPKWRPGVPMREQELRDHFYYWKALHESGRVAIAGALGPDGGLILLRASDQTEADRLVERDPAIKAEIFLGEPFPFVPFFIGSTPIELNTPG